MNIRIASRLAALSIALCVPGQAARAITPGSTYNFCGGNGFTFCASVNISVTAKSGGGYTVAMVIANRSQASGSNAPAQFVSVGLDNVLPPGENLASPSNFRIQQGNWDGVKFTNGVDVCAGKAGCWTMTTNNAEAGGVKVDFDANSATGNQFSLASNCTDAQAHWNVSPVNTCAQDANVALWRPVMISFDVTQQITSADIYIKAIANGSTECITGSSTPTIACVPGIPVTSTPEPATLLLVGSGLAGLALVTRQRAFTGSRRS